MFKKTCMATILGVFSYQAAHAATLEEIVVTAQKRSQSIQDVALSVSAIPSENIERLNLDDVSSLATVIPNLTALDNAAGNPSFRIRGVGLNEFSAAYDSPVGIHLDETFLFKPVLASLGFFDVERVEALKGPQGTVFGRNTTGGAVNYYSNAPSEEFEAGVQLSYGRYDRIEADGYISGSLTDSLSGRLAVQIKDYADNEGPWLNLFDGKRIGELEQNQFRGMLEWSGDKTTVLATLEAGDKEAQLTPYDNLFSSEPGAHIVSPAPGVFDLTAVIRDPSSRSTFNADNTQSTDSSYLGARLRIEHEMNPGTLTSITSYKDFERENTEDSDNTPVRSVNIAWNSQLDSFSQEFRLSGDRDNWTYLFGAYYEDDTTEIVELLDSSDFFGLLLGDDFEVTNESWAIFTNNEFSLTDNVSLVLGARYTEEDVSINGDGYGAIAGTPVDSYSRIASANRIPTSVLSYDQNRNDSDFNWKLGLNFTPNDDVLVYGSASTGFRSGGYDMTFGGATLFAPGSTLLEFDPEDVTAFELGFKSTLLEGSTTLNGALFITEVENYQDNVGLPAQLVPRRQNIGTLETQGAEIDLTWQMSENWMAQWGVGYTDAEVTESSFTVNGLSLEGTTPVNTPEWATSLLVNYNKPISDALVFDALISAQWQDERYLEPENAADHLVSSYSTVDASISLMSADETWSLSLWGKNITDEDYIVYINDVPDFFLFLTIPAEPVTYGLSFNYKF